MSKTLRKLQNCQLRQRERKQSISLYLSYTANGKQHSETLTSVPKRNKEAYRRALEQCEELARKRDTELSRNIDGMMHIAVKDKSFLDFVQFVERSKRNKKLYSSMCLKLKAFLNGKGKIDVTFSELTPNFAIEFRDYLNGLAETKQISFTTACSYMSAFRAVINEALRRELILRNPCASVKPIPKDTVEREFLTLAELEALLSTPLPETKRYDALLYADFFLFICMTGIRPNDVRALTWENIKTDGSGNAFVSFIPSKTKHKTNTLLIIPLNREALKVLERQRERQISWSVGNRLFEGLPPRSSPNTVNAFIRNWLRKAGIRKDISLYNARHSFASNLILSGTGLLEVSRLLGHTTVKHTQIYSHLTESAKRDAVERLRLNVQQVN